MKSFLTAQSFCSIIISGWRHTQTPAVVNSCVGQDESNFVDNNMEEGGPSDVYIYSVDVPRKSSVVHSFFAIDGVLKKIYRLVVESIERQLLKR